jgi:hypothetical protein
MDPKASEGHSLILFEATLYFVGIRRMFTPNTPKHSGLTVELTAVTAFRAPEYGV